jgi:hypothetical protein
MFCESHGLSPSDLFGGGEGKGMVTTRSGNFKLHSDRTSHRTYLRRSDMRPQGEQTTHSCLICLNEMSIVHDKRPRWLQCPLCHEVVHEDCMRKYIIRQTDETFSCANCRASYTKTSFEEDIDLWSADDLIEKLIQDDPCYIERDDSVNGDMTVVHRCLRPRDMCASRIACT